MKLYDIAKLYTVRLKGRTVLVQESFAVLGISVGVALLFASQIASTSLDGSVEKLTTSVVGSSQYQLKARSAQGFNERLLGEVQRLPGVRSAVPVLEHDVSLIGPRAMVPVDLIGTDPQRVQLAGTLLKSFSSQQFGERLLMLATRAARSASITRRRFIARELVRQRVILLPSTVARTAGLSTIGAVQIQVGAKRSSPILTATLRSSGVGALEGTPVGVAALAFVQALTGNAARLTRILVQVRSGAQKAVLAGLLRLAAGHLNVERADSDTALFRQAATPLSQSTSTFAGICALVGFLFAYCAMLLTARARHDLLRELQLAGATRRQTLKVLMCDAMLLGTLACVAGLILGDLLSRSAFRSSAGFLSFAFPAGSQRIITAQSVILSIAAGLLAAGIGVMAPLLRDIWGRPYHRRESATHSSPVWLPVAMLSVGVLCLGATTLVLLDAPQSAILGIATLVLALLLLLPLLVVAAFKAFESLQRRLNSRATALAVLELRAPAARIRSIGVASIAAIAVFGSATIQGSRGNLQTGLERSFHGITASADLWIVPAGTQSLVGTVPFKALNVASLAALPGVSAIGTYRAAFLEFGGRRVWVLAPASTAAYPLPPSQLVEGRIAAVTARLRVGGWAVISRSLAHAFHLRVGKWFTLPAPTPSSFRVAGLSTNLGWPPGAIVLKPVDYTHAWSSTSPTAYNLITAGGRHLSTVAREVRGVLAREGATGLVVQTAVERERSQDAAVSQGLTRLTQMALLVLVAGLLATAASIAAVVGERRRQLARMKALGFPRKTLWLSLLWESAILVGSGCLIGAAFGVYGQLLLSHALISVTGFPVALSTRIPQVIGSAAVVTLAATLVIAIPGYRVASVAPRS